MQPIARHLSTPAETLVPYERFIAPVAWINQGQKLVYHNANPQTNSDVYTLELGSEPRQIFKPGAILTNFTNAV